MDKEIKLSSVVSSVEKCVDFGGSDDDEKVIAFAVVRFKRQNEKASKFAIGSLNDSVSYTLTYDLTQIYTDDEFFDKKGNFDAENAFETFKSELSVGTKEDVNLFDIDISDISEFDKVWNKETGNEVTQLHIATYGNEQNAVSIAKRGLSRAIKDGIYTTEKPNEEENEN